MKLSGSYQINLEKQKVWEALNNPEILKQAIPGCEEFKKKSNYLNIIRYSLQPKKTFLLLSDSTYRIYNYC